MLDFENQEDNNMCTTALSGHMRSQYSKTIADIETDISKLDDEMSRLQTVMGQLAAERQEFRKILGEHHSIVAPIRRIPLEVLSGIFHFLGSVYLLFPRGRVQLR